MSAKRGESGMLGQLSVPLSWGVAVPPDDYDHWAQEPDEGTDADADGMAADGLNSDSAAEGMDGWGDEWEAEPEPRFEVPRSSNVIPHSPAAG